MSLIRIPILIKSIPVYSASEETGKYVGLVNKGAKQNPQSKFTFSNNYTLIKATNTSIKPMLKSSSHGNSHGKFQI
tara:strand:- start:1307 stop:1534 length:228 start_codon:yes stop_codon:yes gene_type:complete